MSFDAMIGTVTQGNFLEATIDAPDNSVDMIFADPPFNIGYEYDLYEDAKGDDEYLTWSAYWIGRCARLLKPTGHFWIAISEEYVSELKLLADGKHLNGKFPRPGPRLFQAHHVIWYYTFGVNCQRKLTRSKTHLLHFVRDRRQFKWNEHAVRVPSARMVEYNDKRANPDGRLPDDTWILRPRDAVFDPCHDAWHCNRICGTFREKRNTPNQMPEQIVGRAIRLSTDPGDLVLDPFAGSGTTAATAKKLGRRFVTTELSPTYAHEARLRVESVQAGDPLDRETEVPDA